MRSFLSGVGLIAGTATEAPLKLTAGPVLTSQVNGAVEFDGSVLFVSANPTSSSGRQAIHASQYAQIQTPATVASGGQFFTATVRPFLVAGHLYRFSYMLKFTKNTAGTATLSFSNSAATTMQLNAWSMLNTVGTGFTSGTTGNIAHIDATAAATTTSSASYSMAAGAIMSCFVTGTVTAAANTRLQLLVTCGAGTTSSMTGSHFDIYSMGNVITSGNIA